MPEPDSLAVVAHHFYGEALGVADIDANLLTVNSSIVLTMDWDPLEFVRDYKFGDAANYMDIFNNVLTMTSDGCNVQALTCRQYLMQKWPANGTTILAAVGQDMLRGNIKVEASDYTIHWRKQPGKWRFWISGFIHTVVEFIRQLVWMGSVLRPSPEKGVLYRSYPKCELSIQSEQIAASKILDLAKTNSLYYTVTYSLEVVEPSINEGTCWQPLFQYPIMAYRPPIARRADSYQD
ncbi:MAG: hypothetical protein GOMPHAMPRED_007879 [Gomphillus americanus]|uniref:Uncharacterized protein n=1 Tax=Gomphillus americanus TaxID=1940652 RepID=A0A8H3EVY0_9LECA|nr:MAG: hypothetical protein GOMPHAMPRED_007879 [Gomphillus americanus]